MRQQLQEMHALSEMVQGFQSANGTEALMKSIEMELPRILDTRNMILTLLDRDTRRLAHSIVVDGGEVQAIPNITAADKNLIEKLAQAREALLIPEEVTTYLQTNRMTPHPQPIASWMGAPMIASGRVVGVLVSYSRLTRRFTAQDFRMLKIVASTLAVTIDNTHLYEQQEERVQRLNTLNTVSLLLASTLDVAVVLDTITTTAGMLSECSGVTLFLNVDEDDPDSLALERGAGLSDAFITAYTTPLLQQFPHKPREKVTDTSPLDENPPLLITEVVEDRHTWHLRDLFAHENIQALMEIPLISGDSRIGIIGMYFEQPQSFGDES
jgi:GAF domain-containing protein